MKAILASAMLTVAAGTAQAQPKPKAAPPPPPQQQAPPPAAAVLFPCRTEQEVCFIGGIKDGKLVVLFTNDPKADEISGKPLAVSGGEGGALDLAGNEGRTVMLTGTYDPKAGLTKAQIVDVASPLAAFAIKAAVGGGGDDGGPPEPPPPPSKKR